MSFSSFNLGSPNVPRYGTGVNFDGIGTGATFYGQQPSTSTGVDYKGFSESIKSLPPELQGKAFEDLLNRSRSQADITQLLNFAREKTSPEARQQALEDALKYQERQQASAAPYKMLFTGLENLAKIPDRIAQQSALQTANTLLGARSITDAYTNTLANYPKLQFASNVPIAQPGKYFS